MEYSSIEEYLNKIRPHLKDIINNVKKSDTWKIQLTISINVMSFKENNEERVMHSKSNNIEFIIYDNTDEVFKNILNRFLIDIKLDWRHQ